MVPVPFLLQPPSPLQPSGPGGSYSDASSAAEAARQYSTMAQQAADAAEHYAKGQEGGSGSGSGSGSPPPPGGFGGGGGGDGVRRFVQRSDSEIQRAYDAVPGPPSKGEILSPGPPSAPPAPPAAPAGLGAGGGDIAGARPVDDLGLPSAPAGAGRPPAAASGSEHDEVDKELEELTRRWAACCCFPWVLWVLQPLGVARTGFWRPPCFCLGSTPGLAYCCAFTGWLWHCAQLPPCAWFLLLMAADSHCRATAYSLHNADCG
jgi:hypothetical protein